MKEVSEQFCNSVHLDHVDQWVRRAAAEDAPFNVVKLIVTRMIGAPRILICFNPVEAVDTPSANPIHVIFIVAIVAVSPAPAVLALSPERVSVGHVKRRQLNVSVWTAMSELETNSSGTTEEHTWTHEGELR